MNKKGLYKSSLNNWIGLRNVPEKYTEPQLWIYAKDLSGSNTPLSQEERTSPKSKVGKWLIFVKKENTNNVWNIIKEATENGKLGPISKVSASTQKTHVICVYTYSYQDKEDIFRIRYNLGILGFKSKIPYKTNIATLKGKYGSGTSTYYG